uniref:U3 small nucleolar RNA-associated protein 14 n=1 Tax=Plectus sambesii TaxID=2011161 RepID=A0A914X8X3_9BILA
MSDGEADFDERLHRKLMRNVARARRGQQAVLGEETADSAEGAVNVDDLIGSIQSASNLNDLKTQLTVTDKRSKVLSAPVHRQQRERIHRSIAYDETKKEVGKWQHIVGQNRAADQLVFPLNREQFRVKTVAETVETMTPRTPLEMEMAAILGTSKHNLTNADPYTDAEKEIMKAMSLKEAKARCADMQRMRALMSYKEAKWKRQKKIKSKQYHRILKRQKRKQLIKEFDDLMTRDPEAAREKLELLERDRVKERATLKHRGGNQWSKQLRLHATRDPKAREKLQDQMRFSRQLTEKHGVDSDSDDASNASDKQPTDETVGETLERLANDIDEEEAVLLKPNPWMRSKLSEMRRKADSSITGSAVTASAFDEQLRRLEGLPDEQFIPDDEDDASTAGDVRIVEIDEPSSDESDIAEMEPEYQEPRVVAKKVSRVSESPKKRKKAKRSEEGVSPAPSSSIQAKNVDLDSLFDSLDKRLIEATQQQNVDEEREQQPKKKKPKKLKLLEQLAAKENATRADADEALITEGMSRDGRTDLDASSSRRGNAASKQREQAARGRDVQAEIMADPKHFLKAETRPVVQVAPDLVEQMDEFDDAEADRQKELLAEAFEDDDVLADFESDKLAAEQSEKPKDIDLTLPGWGDWAGPGIDATKKKKKRFVIKAPEKPRRDRALPGVIINEKAEDSVKKLQVTMIPFPYTSVDDYEAVVRHPIGKEWNPESSHRALTQPNVVTKRGGIIAPMDKEATFKKRTVASISDSSDEDGAL